MNWRKKKTKSKINKMYPEQTATDLCKKKQEKQKWKMKKIESMYTYTVCSLNLTWNVYMCTKWMCVLKYTRSDINDILVLRMRYRTFEMHNKQTSHIKRKKFTHTHAQNGKWNVPHFLVFFIAWPMRDQISKIRWWSTKKAHITTTSILTSTSTSTSTPSPSSDTYTHT